MTTTIIVAGLEAASNTNILQGTRLQTVPKTGVLTFELQASDSDATNFYTVTIQMPGGDTPLNVVRIPCGNSTGLAGVIDSRVDLQASFVISQGGHCVFSCVETGDAEMVWRITYSGP